MIVARRRVTRTEPETSGESTVREHRCICKRLLARISEQGVEIKCLRCKHVSLIRWDSVRAS